MLPTGRKNAQAGDLLKVSDFVKHNTVDGSWEVGTAAYEKRGVEAFVPVWNKDNCIQCNQCAYICPHAAIRPFVLDENELKGFAAADDTLEMKAPAAMKGMHFRIETSVLDCLGCGRSNLFAWLVQELCRHLPGQPQDWQGSHHGSVPLELVRFARRRTPMLLT